MDVKDLTEQELEMLCKYRELHAAQQYTVRCYIAELHGDELTLEVVAGVYASRHRTADANIGDIVDVWQDEDGCVCVRYSSGDWYHYKTDARGQIVWW